MKAPIKLLGMPIGHADLTLEEGSIVIAFEFDQNAVSNQNLNMIYETLLEEETNIIKGEN